jgi:7-carboxy-7-deazaguanine synthase
LKEPEGMSEGFVSEVFSGIQGEGLLVGERQVFIRFAGCNLRCSYCDTPASQTPTDSCRIEQTPGKRDFLTRANPLTAEEVAEHAIQLTHHSSLVFTGGEPLVQPAFAAQVASMLKGNGMSIMLETNGSLPDAPAEVLPFMDIVSMDIKLPSTTGGAELLEAHERFLRTAGEKAHVKIVVTANTSIDELLAAVGMIKSVDAKIPLVLQPVTGFEPPAPSQVLDWQAECLRYLETVRVIPQCHKILGQM